MFPYQIYQALTEQRMRELRAEARHHELVREVLRAERNQVRPPSGLRVLIDHLATLAHLSTRAPSNGARARSATTSPTTSTSTAGPMGCNA
ncbi:MAG: hypothetical protein ABI903_10315 [Actinomycetota bacterium]